jgi:hypothetical protein
LIVAGVVIQIPGTSVHGTKLPVAGSTGIIRQQALDGPHESYRKLLQVEESAATQRLLPPQSRHSGLVTQAHSLLTPGKQDIRITVIAAKASIAIIANEE